jgi:hypothetical protein
MGNMRPLKQYCERCEQPRRLGTKRPKCGCAVEGQRQRRAIKRLLRRYRALARLAVEGVGVDTDVFSIDIARRTRCYDAFMPAIERVHAELEERDAEYELWAYPYEIAETSRQRYPVWWLIRSDGGGFTAPTSQVIAGRERPSWRNTTWRCLDMVWLTSMARRESYGATGTV